MKNKGIKAAVLAIVSICIFTGCTGGAGTHAQTGSQSIGQVIQSGINEADSLAVAGKEDSTAPAEDSSNGTVVKLSEETDTGRNSGTGNGSEEGSVSGNEAETNSVTDNTEDTSAGADEGSENGMTEEISEDPAKDSNETEKKDQDIYTNIDVDLSVLSGGLVYSEVYNMMADPNSYIGKVIKMTGSYSYYYDEMGDKEYHACIIQDATACCAQGIEFVTTDDFKYPDDFPETGQDITVTGVFDIYYEADFVFMTLRDAVIG